MRKVILATPCHGRSVGADYHHAVVQSVKACAVHDIDLRPLLWPGEALVQHARNALAQLALDMKPDDVMWVDADQEWEPGQLLRLLGHPVDVVGAAYPKKTDEEQYPVRLEGPPAWPMTYVGNLLLVDGLGTGFLRTSARALRAVWEKAEPYEAFGGSWRACFEVRVDEGRLVGEDVDFCRKLRSAGFPVHLDPSFTVAHHGAKRYTGDFAAYLARLNVK